MHSPQKQTLLALLFAATSTLVRCQQVIPAPEYHNGWCYFCSDDNAPALCNSECTVAINELCNEGDLRESLQATHKNCQVKYMPPVYPMRRQGSRSYGVPVQTCLDSFNGILNSCGKDAGTPEPEPIAVNQSYCTTSGGGGTYGWNDDGSVMINKARYVVTTANTNQCGQSEASWQQATSVIQWNASWVQPGDQVVLDTNPPPLTGSAAAQMTAIPPPNPECDNEVCDIYDNPYYAHSPVAPWPEEKNMMRHRIAYEGWSEDDRSTRLFDSIYDRCGVYADNFQPYMGQGKQRIADFNLPYGRQDLCWCIPDAVFDASVGIVMPRNAFCGGTVLTDTQGNNEFNVVPE